MSFHLPHVRILGTHQCGKDHREAFKNPSKQHGVSCRSDYLERVVFSLSHKIKSDYYGGNHYVYIEGIALDNCNA